MPSGCGTSGHLEIVYATLGNDVVSSLILMPKGFNTVKSLVPLQTHEFFSHSLPDMLHGSQNLQSREQLPEPRRRSLSRSEGWELPEFPKKSQGRERKGER